MGWLKSVEASYLHVALKDIAVVTALHGNAINRMEVHETIDFVNALVNSKAVFCVLSPDALVEVVNRDREPPVEGTYYATMLHNLRNGGLTGVVFTCVGVEGTVNVDMTGKTCLFIDKNGDATDVKFV